MKKTLLIFALTAALVLSMAACGSAPAKTEPAAESQVAEIVETPAEDGQNPVMNFVGVYSTEYSMEALVEAEGMEDAKITITYAGSPWFHTQTVMSGRFDPETLTMEFSNATLTELNYNSDGSVAIETISYVDGGGKGF